MFSSIYIEKDILEHPRVKEISKRFSDVRTIICDRYMEVFNRKAQDFRVQKKNPALIIARKHDNFVLKAPDEYGIGSTRNYYYSHMLNCLYDCRYCFLQGMYRSANYVLFINYEEFDAAIQNMIDQNNKESLHFFNGYDCDSLAFEPVTGFAAHSLRFIEKNPQALFEFRTKSTQARLFYNQPPLANVVLAFSFTPEAVSQALEHKVPTIRKRLGVMQKLQRQGWTLGLRFDPVIYTSHYQQQYRELYSYLFSNLETDLIHSVSLGSIRLPKGFYQTMSRLYPDEILFASPLEEQEGMISYKKQIQQDMLEFNSQEILKYVSKETFYPCQ